MAGSLVILVVAGLFVRSLTRAQGVDLGFQPDRVMNFVMDPGQQGYDEKRTTSLYRALIARVRSLPGVESASLAHSVPLGYYDIAQRLEKEGQVLAPSDQRWPRGGAEATTTVQASPSDLCTIVP